MISCIALYFIFRKMGIEGYKAFVPVYNQYLIFKNTYSTKKFWLTFGLSLGATLLMLIGMGLFTSSLFNFYFNNGLIIAAGILMVLALVPAVWAIVLSIKSTYYFARSMSEGKGFGIFAIFFTLIAYIIMAFDRDYQYQSNYYEEKKTL